MAATFIPWNLATLAGVTLGGQITDPSRLGLDVIFPAAMAGLCVGLITGRRELVAAVGRRHGRGHRQPGVGHRRRDHRRRAGRPAGRTARPRARAARSRRLGRWPRRSASDARVAESFADQPTSTIRRGRTGPHRPASDRATPPTTVHDHRARPARAPDGSPSPTRRARSRCSPRASNGCRGRRSTTSSSSGRPCWRRWPPSR